MLELPLTVTLFEEIECCRCCVSTEVRTGCESVIPCSLFLWSVSDLVDATWSLYDGCEAEPCSALTVDLDGCGTDVAC